MAAVAWQLPVPGVRRLLYLLFAVVAANARSQAGEWTCEELPFEFRDGLIWLSLKTPSSEKSLNFLLDSGAQVSVLNKRTARELGLRGGRRVKVRGVNSTTDGRWPVRLTARGGNLSLPRRYLALDLDAISKACHCRIDGLLGADFFRDRAVELNFTAKRIRVFDACADIGDGIELPLEVGATGMRIPVGVHGSKPEWVRLDTGCASALQWVVSAFTAEPHPAQLAVGLMELSIPTTVASVRLGRVTFDAVPVGLHRRPIFSGESGLLGNGLLSKFSSVVVDAREGRVILHR